MQIRTRTAPSPTGDPHIGTAYAAMFNIAFARKNNGKFVLRIEDTDRERFNPTSQKRIIEALDWLDLRPDEGPEIGGAYGPYIQTQRLPLYHKYVEKLLAEGNAYYCFCSKERLEQMRKEQEKMRVQPKYDRTCLHLSKEDVAKKLANNEPHVVRMKVPDEELIVFEDLIRGEVRINTNQIDDQVILKSDGIPVYHLAAVVDDHEMQISHVIRGEEWLSSTPKHILLYRMLGWTPPIWAHFPLLRNPDKSKMSKRKNDTSIEIYKNKGYLPDALKNFLMLLGWSHPDGKEIFSFDEFVEKFDFNRFSTTGPIFDVRKLDWMNGVYIRNLSLEEFGKQVRPFVTEVSLSEKPDTYFHACLALIQERMKRLAEANELLFFFYKTPDAKPVLEEFWKDKDVHTLQDAVESLIPTIATIETIDHETWEQSVRAVAEKYTLKAGDLFMALRIAITGSKNSPPLFETMRVLGDDVCVERIKETFNLQ